MYDLWVKTDLFSMNPFVLSQLCTDFTGQCVFETNPQKCALILQDKIVNGTLESFSCCLWATCSGVLPPEQSGEAESSPLTCCHPPLDAAQDTIGLLGCRRTLLAHVQSFTHQYPQVLFRRGTLNPFIPQPVLISGAAPTQVQGPALGLVKPHDVHVGPPLKLVQVPLDGVPSLQHVNGTTQRVVINKFAQGAFDCTVHVINEDTKQYY